MNSGVLKMRVNETDAKKFHTSITKELNIIKNRVRNLIGSSNWGEDGRYKEAILRNVIRRFLPSNLSLGTGFIIRKNNNDIKISNQIDIIIYDNTIPVLFSEGDFIITTYKNVKGIIEVKTKIRNSDLKDILEKAEKNGELIGNKKFNGIFSYEFEGDIESNNVETTLKDLEGYVNHISFGKNWFVKLWDRQERSMFHVDAEECDNNFYNIYELEGLSFSYFISNLLDITCSNNFNDRFWFLYPVEGTKERYIKKSICLDKND